MTQKHGWLPLEDFPDSDSATIADDISLRSAVKHETDHHKPLALHLKNKERIKQRKMEKTQALKTIAFLLQCAVDYNKDEDFFMMYKYLKEALRESEKIFNLFLVKEA
jgi:hypothetical protein